jgi:hypothetical protein
MRLPLPAPPAPEPTTQDLITAAAIEHARRWKLVADNGEITCVRGCGRVATLPSLCCATCLAARRGRWR